MNEEIVIQEAQNRFWVEKELSAGIILPWKDDKDWIEKDEQLIKYIIDKEEYEWGHFVDRGILYKSLVEDPDDFMIQCSIEANKKLLQNFEKVKNLYQ